MRTCRFEWGRLGVGLIAALLLPWPTHALARDLSEILADKELISREEYKEASRTRTKPSIAYKEGKGFVFETADGRFSLAMGGRLQARYTLTDVDSRFTGSAKGTEDSQSFDIPRARVWWEGTAFSPKLFYKLQIDVAGGGGDILRDMELGYVLLDDQKLAIKGGQFKTPFCRQEMTSSGRLEFVERSLACQSFRFERARGLMLYGTPMDALLEYYAGAFNTTGRNGPSNPDMNFLYVTRLAVNPLGPIPYSEGDFASTPDPRFAIGVSYAFEKARGDVFTTAATTGPDPDDPSEKVITQSGQKKNNVPYLQMIQPFYNKLANPSDLTVEVNNLEADLAARWLGIDLQFEYFYAFNDTSTHSGAAPAPPYALPPKSFDSHGYYAQAGYFVIPKKLQIAARYSEITPNDEAEVTKASGRRVTQGQNELLGAVSWYFAEHNLKLQTDFGPVQQIGVKDLAGDVTNRNDFRWRVQAQLIF